MKKALAAALALALVPAGCGSDDEKKSGGGAPKPSKVTIELSGSGKKLKFAVPRSVKGGLTELTFTNSTDAGRTAQLVRADRGHTAQEALQAAGAWAEGEGGKPLPPWAHTAGGFGEVPAGETRKVTQELPAGDYVVAEIDTNATAPFKVTRGAGGSPIGTKGRIAASEYKFTSTGLTAGKSKILFDNTGAEPHFAVGAALKPGKTMADVRRFLREEKGEDPLDERMTLSTAVVDGGVSQSVEVELKKGKYALLCFVPDRKGGPPHAIKGMVSEATVR